jgi:hypothetical protein
MTVSAPTTTGTAASLIAQHDRLSAYFIGPSAGLRRLATDIVERLSRPTSL